MTDKEFIKICENSKSMFAASKTIGMAFSTFKRKAIKLGCYVTNQGGKNTSKDKIKVEDILSNKIRASNESIKKKLLRDDLIQNCCHNDKCTITNEWLGVEIKLELDHIDGNPQNNTLSNLRLLCPNCHSQTPTYRGRNVKRVKPYSDDELKVAITTSYTISEVCLKLNIAPKGGNYHTIKKKMSSLGLDLKVKYKQIINRGWQSKELNRCECGVTIKSNSKQCVKCYQRKSRKVVRPPYDELIKEIENTSYVAVGKKYGVSDNTIRKWKKYYEKQLNNGA